MKIVVRRFMQIKKWLAVIFLVIGFFTCANAQSFLKEQSKYARVKNAIEAKHKLMVENLQTHQLSINNYNLLITVFKAEKKMMLYGKSITATTYTLIATYNICASSGELGPKRQYGDNQVPEGFYYISRYNPVSNYYVSLGISYPNASDKIKSKAKNMGGDIFIHGNCVTIGCMPMTDDKIKEIYLYAMYAHNNGQTQIPVYIFPFMMDDKNFADYKSYYKTDVALIRFWQNIKIGHDKFYGNKQQLNVTVDASGNYVFK